MWIKVAWTVYLFVLSAILSLYHCLGVLFINYIGKYIQAKELDVNSEYYIELLAKGTGKSEEEIAKDVQRTRYFQAQDALDYGIADRIMDSGEAAYEKRVINMSLLLMFMFILNKKNVFNTLSNTLFYWLNIIYGTRFSRIHLNFNQ